MEAPQQAVIAAVTKSYDVLMLKNGQRLNFCVCFPNKCNLDIYFLLPLPTFAEYYGHQTVSKCGFKKKQSKVAGK